MFCCSNCFVDEDIKSIIESHNKKGTCDFCGCHDAFVYEIEKNSTITALFDPLLDTYTPISLLPSDFPRQHTGLLKDILYHDWKIFNLNPDVIYKLITALCVDRYSDQPELFDTPIGILEIQSSEYMEAHSILKGYEWADFDIGIKTKNRFHSDFINTDELDFFLQYVVEIYRKEQNPPKQMYRSRICPNREGFDPSERGAPPNHIAKDGRVNPVGISVLYLSNAEKTTLHEVRVTLYDFVTIGTFELQKDIQIINLSKLDQISPSLLTPNEFDLTEYAINLPHLKRIALEIAKPLRNANVLEYLPTQYICDFIRSRGYDGIEYNSTMHKGGVNLAVFEPDVFKCTKTKVCEIYRIDYDHKEL